LRKAQVTVFVIVGIVILIAVAIALFYISKTAVLPSIKPSDNTEEYTFKTYLQTCLETNTKSSILEIASLGGYYESPNDSQVIYMYDLNPLSSQNLIMRAYPMYLFDNKTILPTFSEIQKNTEDMVLDNFLSCANQYNNSVQNSSISFDNANLSLVMTENNTLVKVTYKYHTSNDYLKDNQIAYNIPVSISKAYNISIKFIKNQSKDPSYFDIGLLSSLAYWNNFTFDTRIIENSTYLFTLKFPYYNTTLGKSLEYMFVIKYDY